MFVYFSSQYWKNNLNIYVNVATFKNNPNIRKAVYVEKEKLLYQLILSTATTVRLWHLDYIFVQNKHCSRFSKLSMHVKILQKKMNLLKTGGPQIRICVFTFRPIASKQFNSLTTIDSPVDSVVQRLRIRFGCERSRLQFPAPAVFLCSICVVVVFLLFVRKHIICHNYF